MNRTTLRVKGRVVVPDIWYAGYERDNNVEEVYFDLPPERDGEMLTLHMEQGDHTEAIALGTSRSWVITRTQTQYPGEWTAWLSTNDDIPDQHWSSANFRIMVAKGNEEYESNLQQEYPTAVEQALEAANKILSVYTFDGVDETLKVTDGILGVNTTNVVEQDNTQPVTSAAVHMTVGNINALLETI